MAERWLWETTAFPFGPFRLRELIEGIVVSLYPQCLNGIIKRGYAQIDSEMKRLRKMDETKMKG